MNPNREEHYPSKQRVLSFQAFLRRMQTVRAKFPETPLHKTHARMNTFTKRRTKNKVARASRKANR